jgi:hypothetical protein
VEPLTGSTDEDQQVTFRWRAGGAPGARTLNPRIKSLSGMGSAGFISVRAAGQTARAYGPELFRTAVNCNPNCNPGRCSEAPSRRVSPVDVHMSIKTRRRDRPLITPSAGS